MTGYDQPDLYAALLGRLHTRARRLTSCPAEAADLAQDAALKLWHRTQTGARIDDPQAYAMITLRNLARSRWRSRAPCEELRDETASTPPDAPRRIACAQLRAAIGRLPATQAELMWLVVQGETSPSDLARITGTPLGTVMSRLARARSRLRKDMDLGATDPSDTLFGPDV